MSLLDFIKSFSLISLEDIEETPIPELELKDISISEEDFYDDEIYDEDNNDDNENELTLFIDADINENTKIIYLDNTNDKDMTPNEQLKNLKDIDEC